jgi:tetratricopeptide (TPR) repeat protein
MNFRRLLLSQLLLMAVVVDPAFASQRLICPSGTKFGAETPIEAPGAKETHYCVSKDGIKTGPYVSYYSNGSVFSKGQYKSGKRVGTSQAFYRSGEIAQTAQWANDLHDGPLVMFYKNGKPLSEVLFKEDKVISQKTFDRMGRQVSKLTDLKLLVAALEKADWPKFNEALGKIDLDSLGADQYRRVLKLTALRQMREHAQKLFSADIAEKIFALELPDPDEDGNYLTASAALTICLDFNKRLADKQYKLLQVACSVAWETTHVSGSNITLKNGPMLVYGAYAAENKYTEAGKFFTYWLERRPKDPELNMSAGLNAFKLNLFKEADKYLKVAMKENPSNDQAAFIYFVNLASLGEKNKSTDGLKKLCDKGVQNVCECIKKNGCSSL